MPGPQFSHLQNKWLNWVAKFLEVLTSYDLWFLDWWPRGSETPVAEVVGQLMASSVCK